MKFKQSKFADIFKFLKSKNVNLGAFWESNSTIWGNYFPKYTQNEKNNEKKALKGPVLAWHDCCKPYVSIYSTYKEVIEFTKSTEF